MSKFTYINISANTQTYKHNATCSTTVRPTPKGAAKLCTASTGYLPSGLCSSKSTSMYIPHRHTLPHPHTYTNTNTYVCARSLISTLTHGRNRHKHAQTFETCSNTKICYTYTYCNITLNHQLVKLSNEHRLHQKVKQLITVSAHANTRKNTHTQTHILPYMHAHAHTHTHTHMYLCTHTNMHCMCTYTDTALHTQTHYTHTHTHTHTHTLFHSLFGLHQLMAQNNGNRLQQIVQQVDGLSALCAQSFLIIVLRETRL